MSDLAVIRQRAREHQRDIEANARLRTPRPRPVLLGPNERLLDAADVAKRWGVSRDIIRNIGRKELPYLAIGRRRRYWPADVERAEKRKTYKRIIARRLRANAPRAISVRTRSLVFERDNFRCRRCGAGPTDTRLVVDHIVPVALGGGGAIGNLQTLCVLCNAGKAGRAPHAHDLAVQS